MRIPSLWPGADGTSSFNQRVLARDPRESSEASSPNEVRWQRPRTAKLSIWGEFFRIQLPNERHRLRMCFFRYPKPVPTWIRLRHWLEGVINALNRKSSAVPYRNSFLTKVLKVLGNSVVGERMLLERVLIELGIQIFIYNTIHFYI